MLAGTTSPRRGSPANSAHTCAERGAVRALQAGSSRSEDMEEGADERDTRETCRARGARASKPSRGAFEALEVEGGYDRPITRVESRHALNRWPQGTNARAVGAPEILAAILPQARMVAR